MSARPCIEHSQKLPYAHVGLEGAHIRLHVRVWQETHGRPRPEGHVIHHTCENQRCIEPSHLVAIPDREHRQLHTIDSGRITSEAAARIRDEYAALPRAPRRDRKRRPLKSPNGSRLAPGVALELAAKYGISVSYLKTIVQRGRAA